MEVQSPAPQNYATPALSAGACPITCYVAPNKYQDVFVNCQPMICESLKDTMGLLVKGYSKL